MIVGIIGGGASGMAAALEAARNKNVQVILFERQARVGRKLQATGNGRCNLTNVHAGKGGFHGTDAAFAAPALEVYNPELIRCWFRSLGLHTVKEPSGRVYPYSDQANSVVDILRFSLERPNVTLHTGCEILKAKKTAEGFELFDGENTHFCHKLIIACGGLAGTKLGGSLSGYRLLGKFGHRSTKLRPALVQLKSNWQGCAALKGVRANCRVEILHDGEVFAQSAGEIQFTEYGLSGPVIFEVSRDVAQQKGSWVARLNFMPQELPDSFLREMKGRRHSNLPVEELMTGILHNRLGRVLTKAAGISGKQWVKDLTDAELEAVCRSVFGFEVEITEPMGMDSAQVTAGGVLTEDFDPVTMESKLVPGLYACGEVLDIDGDCGGYNLQWAWASGRSAGKAARKDAE